MDIGGRGSSSTDYTRGSFITTVYGQSSTYKTNNAKIVMDIGGFGSLQQITHVVLITTV